jgi:hypothetical protein
VPILPDLTRDESVVSSQVDSDGVGKREDQQVFNIMWFDAASNRKAEVKPER